MGVLSLGDKGKVKTSGTEIGAFVRLDDLDAGYSFKELDRSVFMNPDKVNAVLSFQLQTIKMLWQNMMLICSYMQITMMKMVKHKFL